MKTYTFLRTGICAVVLAGALALGGCNTIENSIEQRSPIDQQVWDGPSTKRVIEWQGRERAGTIVIETSDRTLTLVQKDGTALQYTVGVGRRGFEWSGNKTISQKKVWPGWTPPPQMHKRQKGLPGHMEGGVANPLGARAMYLGSSLYRIHGSNDPQTIGQAVSSGCFRMNNVDVMDLFERVHVGTPVIIRR